MNRKILTVAVALSLATTHATADPFSLERIEKLCNLFLDQDHFIGTYMLKINQGTMTQKNMTVTFPGTPPFTATIFSAGDRLGIVAKRIDVTFSLPELGERPRTLGQTSIAGRATGLDAVAGCDSKQNEYLPRLYGDGVFATGKTLSADGKNMATKMNLVVIGISERGAEMRGLMTWDAQGIHWELPVSLSPIGDDDVIKEEEEVDKDGDG